MSKNRHVWSISLIVLCFALTRSATAQSSVKISATPTSNIITAGNAASYQINIARTKYSGDVKFSAAGSPSNATATFSPNPSGGAVSALKITTQTTTPPGTYQITVKATAPGVTIEPIVVSLKIKPAPSIAITTDAEVQCVMTGQTATYVVDIQRTNFDGPISFTASGVPAGVESFFEPPTTSGNRVYYRLLPSFNFGSGSGEITVRAAASGLSVSRKLRLFVNCGLQWTAQTGSYEADNTTSPSYEAQSKITTDSSGNVYVVGSTTGGMEDSGVANQGNTDVYLIKFDAYGSRIWTRQFGGAGEDRATEVKTDTTGNIFLAGYTRAAIDASTIHHGNFDVWAAKFAPDGTRLGITQIGNAAEQGPYGIELQPDNNGGVVVFYVSGERGRRRVSVERTSLFGAIGGAASFSVPASAVINELAVTIDGSIYVAGHVPSFNTGGDPGGWNSAWAAKINNGSWEQTFGVFNRDERANRIVADNAGNIYLTGCRLSGISENNEEDASCHNADDSAAAAATEDAWVKKLNAANGGAETWERTFATPARDVIVGADIDFAGSVLLTGLTDGALVQPNAGSTDVWLARFDTGGGRPILRQFGSAGNDRGLTVAVSNSGAVLVSGTSDSNFGGPHLGNTDVWVMQYAPGSASNAVTNFSPAAGPVGTTVNIEGNFGLLVTEVRFGGVAAGFTIFTDPVTRVRSIRATVPAGAISGRVTVSYLALQGDCPFAVSATNFTVR